MRVAWALLFFLCVSSALNDEAIIDEARQYLNAGLFDKAEVKLVSLISADSSSMSGHVALGRLYIHQKKYESALPVFENALKLEPRDPMVLVMIGKVYSNLHQGGNKAKAAKYAKKVRELDSADAVIQYELGMLSFVIGQHNEGRQAFERSRELNSSLDRKFLGKVYGHYQHHDWAAVEFEAALDNSQQIDVEATMLLAECKEILGFPDDAVNLYRAVLNEDGRNAIAHANLGLLLLGTGIKNMASLSACGLNSDIPLKHLKIALKIKPDLSSVSEAIDFCDKEQKEAIQWEQVSHSKSILSTVGKRNPFQALKKRIAFIIMSVLNSVGIKLHSTNQVDQSAKISRMCDNWSQRERKISSAPRIEIATESSFMHYAESKIPVVITNFQQNWGNGSDFSPQSLIKKFGNDIVRVSVSQNGRFDGPEKGSQWGLSDTEEVLVRPPTTSMYFKDFLVLSGSQRKFNDENFYMEYMALHQYLGKNFLELIPLPRIVDELVEKKKQGSSDGLELLVSNLWLSYNRPTISPLHYDDYENLLCQIKGTKEIILFPPSDYKRLYYTGRAKGILQYDYKDGFHRNLSSLDTRSFEFGSSVNIDDPDYLKHPLYKQANPIRVVLKAGDVLFLPSYWHHEVQSLPDERSHLNLAVNFWFTSVSKPENAKDFKIE